MKHFRANWLTFFFLWIVMFHGCSPSEFSDRTEPEDTASASGSESRFQVREMFEAQLIALDARGRQLGLDLVADPSLPRGVLRQRTTDHDLARHAACLNRIETLDSRILADPGFSLDQVSDCWQCDAERDETLKTEILTRHTKALERGGFDPHAEGFSLINAVRLCDMVGIATLEDEDEIRRRFQEMGFGSANLIKSRDVHCVVAENAESLVLAFRGSTTLTDWINDVKFAQLRESESGLPGRVHRGFFRALESRWLDIEPLLRSADNAGKAIWITGHSLGGGLSHLAAMRAAESGIDVSGVVTFASPKAGDATFIRAFLNQFDGRAFRIVNGSDPVPHLPPSETAENKMKRSFKERFKVSDANPFAGALEMADYAHGGGLYVFSDGGTFTGLHPYTDQDDVDYWNTLKAKKGGGSWISLIRDQEVAQKHYLDQYIELLHQALGR